jgi:tRNA (adenine22-N1)-methyltransferase
VSAGEVEDIAIAGMGGETIFGILNRANGQIPVGTKFVLQPMTRDSVLRRFLYEAGYKNL